MSFCGNQVVDFSVPIKSAVNYSHCMIADFCHELAENCTLLRYYAVSGGNFLLMFLDNHLQGSRIQIMLRNNPKECSSQLFSLPRCIYNKIL
jgi:hypothetical protein